MKAKLPGAPSSPALATSPRTQGALCSPKLPPHRPAHSTFSSRSSPHRPQPSTPQSSHLESTFPPYRNHPASQIKLGSLHLCIGAPILFPPLPTPQDKQPNLALGTPHPWHSPLCLLRLTASNRPGVQRLDLTSPQHPAPDLLRYSAPSWTNQIAHLPLPSSKPDPLCSG